MEAQGLSAFVALLRTCVKSNRPVQHKGTRFTPELSAMILLKYETCGAKAREKLVGMKPAQLVEWAYKPL